MSYSISEIIERFCDGTDDLGTGNVYIRNGTLFSYGSHFPLMLRMQHKSWNSRSRLLNADKYSPSTSNHQSYCFDDCDQQIPFSALNHIIIDSYGNPIPYSDMVSGNKYMQRLRIVDASDPRYDLVGYRTSTNGLKSPISVAQYSKLENGIRMEYEQITERRPSSCILQYGKKYYLSSMDFNQFFIVQLPKKVSSVADAFQLLKPKQLALYRDKGYSSIVDTRMYPAEYVRQGEWFILPITEYMKFDADTNAAKKRQYDILTKDFILPRKTNDSNPHTATRGGFITDIELEHKLPFKVPHDTIVISGQLRHPEHNMMHLSTLEDIKFFLCLENTAVNAWSAMGGVD